ncbi:DUF3179 domain-containing protein [Candidatus Amesbacteria bacterium]|nr:DUF3179 domain-containing protein [Candidatus Amesbacteria bacterium]
MLSRNTGFSRDYDQYPYGTYEQDGQLLFGVKDLDHSLQIKTIVYGVEVDGFSKAYPEGVFDKNSTINDQIGSIALKLEKQTDGKITVTNETTGESVIPIRLFWFAWAAFHPNTELYRVLN